MGLMDTLQNWSIQFKQKCLNCANTCLELTLHEISTSKFQYEYPVRIVAVMEDLTKITFWRAIDSANSKSHAHFKRKDLPNIFCPLDFLSRLVVYDTFELPVTKFNFKFETYQMLISCFYRTDWVFILFYFFSKNKSDVRNDEGQDYGLNPFWKLTLYLDMKRNERDYTHRHTRIYVGVYVCIYTWKNTWGIIP